MTRSRTRVCAAAVGVALAVHTAMAVDVKVESDKTFDFTSIRTWGWNPDGPGDVRMARTQEDDPEVARQQAEPLIMSTVDEEMKGRGLQRASGAPDVFVTYYLLLTTNASAQTVGQFVPTVAQWGLPPFPPATQSLKLMNRGSLVLDVSSRQTVVWRGVAQANIKPDADRARREALLREAVRDLLRRFPRRS